LPIDKQGVSPLEQTATQLFEAAETAAQLGEAAPEWTVLLTPEGAVTIMTEPGWSLDAIAGERGAEAAFRISRGREAIRVEGRAGRRRCLIEERRHPSSYPSPLAPLAQWKREDIFDVPHAHRLIENHAHHIEPDSGIGSSLRTGECRRRLYQSAPLASVDGPHRIAELA